METNLIKLAAIILSIYVSYLPIIGRTQESTISIFIIKCGLIAIATILTVQLIKNLLTNLNK